MPRFQKDKLPEPLFTEDLLKAILEKCKESKTTTETLSGLVNGVLNNGITSSELKKLIMLYAKIKRLRYRVYWYTGERKMELTVEQAEKLQLEEAAKFGLGPEEVKILVEVQAVPNIRRKPSSGTNYHTSIVNMGVNFCASRFQKYVPQYKMKLLGGLREVFLEIQEGCKEKISPDSAKTAKEFSILKVYLKRAERKHVQYFTR